MPFVMHATGKARIRRAKLPRTGGGTIQSIFYGIKTELTRHTFGFPQGDPTLFSIYTSRDVSVVFADRIVASVFLSASEIQKDRHVEFVFPLTEKIVMPLAAVFG